MESSSDVNPAFAAWKSCQGREKEWALQELVRRLEKFASRICWQRLPDHKDDFGGLVNGIVWRAIKKAEQFRGRARFSTWFYRIVVNECNKYLRNYKERCETSLEEEMPTVATGIDARIDLIALLDRLKREDHILFRLVAEGEDFNTIGERLGINRNAALVRWNRLKRKIRDAAV
jgi:RNA polymerase sigma factor (sigma-70 family)